MDCSECIKSIKPVGAVMNITDQCNFRCPYCFVHHNPRRMSLETARAACEWLLKTGENPTLSFFGGEPMLEFESVIKPIVLEYGDKMKFNITTNGSLLSEDVIDFLFDHSIQVLLSIDGIAEVQNVNRPYADGRPTFHDVIKNVPYLLLKFPETLFRATLTRNAIPHMFESYELAKHMGFTQMTFVVNEGEDYDEADYERMMYEYDKIAVDILKGSPCKLVDIEKARQFNSASEENTHRCGYGTTSVGITVDGKITPCQELSSFDFAIIGDVFSGIDENLHQQFLSKAVNKTILPEGLTPQQRRIMTHGVCPKHQYYDNNFEITTGRFYQLKAMSRLLSLFSGATEYSNNEIFWRAGQ